MYQLNEAIFHYNSPVCSLHDSTLWKEQCRTAKVLHLGIRFRFWKVGSNWSCSCLRFMKGNAMIKTPRHEHKRQIRKRTRWRMVQTQLARSINPPIQVKSNQIKPKSKSNQSQRQSQITPNKIKIRRGRKLLRLSIEVDVLTIHATWQVTAKWIVEVWAKFSKSNHDWKANNTQNVFF